MVIKYGWKKDFLKKKTMLLIIFPKLAHEYSMQLKEFLAS